MVKEMQDNCHGFGLRAVAVLEGIKGVLILGLGFGFLALRHTDVHAAVDTLVSKVGVNHKAHYPRLFAEHLASVGDKGLRLFAIIALLVSILRFTEALGLWCEKAWAEWLTPHFGRRLPAFGSASHFCASGMVWPGGAAGQ